MLKIVSIFSALIVAVFASGQLTILHNPTSLEFEGKDDLPANLLSDVFLASLGHSFDNQEDWNGLYIINPFRLPKTALILLVDGFEKIYSDDVKSHSFPLSGSYNSNTLGPLVSRIDNIVDVDLDSGLDSIATLSTAFGDIKPTVTKITSSLKTSNSADKDFLEKIAILEALTDKLTTAKNFPELLIIRLSLSELFDAHSISSAPIADAMKILSNTVDKLTKTADESNNGNVLIAAIAFKEELSRSKRATDSRQTTPLPENLNLAKPYSADYPVIFNIILWFGVIFFFSLLAISYAIAAMDPGRDSIIYRMTSTRMKKDN